MENSCNRVSQKVSDFSDCNANQGCLKKTKEKKTSEEVFRNFTLNINYVVSLPVKHGTRDDTWQGAPVHWCQLLLAGIPAMQFCNASQVIPSWRGRCRRQIYRQWDAASSLRPVLRKTQQHFSGLSWKSSWLFSPV